MAKYFTLDGAEVFILDCTKLFMSDGAKLFMLDETEVFILVRALVFKLDGRSCLCCTGRKLDGVEVFMLVREEVRLWTAAVGEEVWLKCEEDAKPSQAKPNF